MKKRLVILLCVLLSFGAFAQKFDLAKTPPMGWNSWNKFGCKVNEKVVMKVADAMVSSGMQAAGYEYIVIDDCWQISRDKDGEIVVDKTRFPHGIKYLADYIHSKGLKFGIYTCAGTKTCAGRPGALGHEYQDARTYARWGVDYLKEDWCNTTTQDAKSSYTNMRDALFTAGRPIVLSLCEWGSNKPWEWAGPVGHLWRTTGDIRDSWDSMIHIVDLEKDLSKYAGPGHWNDPDMLEVGNGGMTIEEDKTHFSMWCMLAAPLMAGNDLENMSKETMGILTNANLIAVDQDSLGKQAICAREVAGYEIWIKPLVKEGKAVCLLNRSDEEKTVHIDFNYLLTENGDYWHKDKYELKDYYITDLWENIEAKMDKSGLSTVKIPPHSVKVYSFIKK
ncbi:MAG: glycoside hydrolase family 27 protein [Prolixibacteraceae bacterium]|nr:glycoside hydrolase family 27 protein [Prolixibacteraceae bacterium]